MNEQLMLRLLYETLRDADIQIHRDLMKDIRRVLGKSGEEKAFFNKLAYQLQVLSAKAAFDHPDHERLRGVDGLYSMHVNTKNINCRILYTYIQEECHLLYAFYEKKGTSAAGYPDAISAALKRKKDLEGSK